MNILHIIETLDIKRGGLPTALQLVLRVENTLGYHSEVLSMRSGSEVEVELSLLPEQIHLFPFSFPSRFHNSADAYSWLNQNGKRFDLIVIHSVWYVLGVRTAIWAKRNEIPYVVWPHGSLEPYDLKKKRLLKKLIGNVLVKRILTNSNSVVCTNKMESDCLETFGGTPIVTILPFSVNSPPCTDAAPEGFRKKYNIKENEFVFLFLSRIHPKKRLDLILLGISRLIEEGNKVRLVVAGDFDSADYKTKIDTFVYELALKENVIFSGWLTGQAKYSAFRGANCFILPSMVENFGIVVAEALNSNLPVLLSNRVFIWQEIVGENAGWVCEPDEVSVLEKMRLVLKDPIDYEMKKASTSRAARMYSMDVVGELYKKQYQLFGFKRRSLN